MAVYGSGVFSNLGSATPLAQMNAGVVLAAMEAGALGPGSGRMVLLADSTPLATTSLGGFFSSHEKLFLNSIAYLSVPEPSSVVLGMTAAVGALGLVGRAGVRRRCRSLPRASACQACFASASPRRRG